jgi:hypothetical protein
MFGLAIIIILNKAIWIFLKYTIKLLQGLAIWIQVHLLIFYLIINKLLRLIEFLIYLEGKLTLRNYLMLHILNLWFFFLKTWNILEISLVRLHLGRIEIDLEQIRILIQDELILFLSSRYHMINIEIIFLDGIRIRNRFLNFQSFILKNII